MRECSKPKLKEKENIGVDPVKGNKTSFPSFLLPQLQKYSLIKYNKITKIKIAIPGMIRREKVKALSYVMKKLSQDPGVHQQTKKLGH